MTALERVLENQFVDIVEADGNLCLKLQQVGRVGFPDRTVIAGGNVLFIEFKRSGKDKLRPGQVKGIAELRERGANVLVTHDLDEAVAFYRKFL
jgi:hypothetical protein